MEQLPAWLADPRLLAAAAAFLASVAAAFAAGYVVGRGARPGPAPPAPRRARRPVDEGPPPEVAGDEAHLMDLTALRDDEGEPPPSGPPAHPR